MVVLLDGEQVSSVCVDPKKHRFIGKFRSPDPPAPTPECRWAVYMCACGQSLWYVEGVRKHWMEGHMDLNQYITISTGVY